MYFRQLYLTCLAQATYLIGSEGEAAVVDPRRDVDELLALAEQEGLRIRYVIETHLHADFVSGHAELARRTGATVLIGARAKALFAHRPVSDGQEITFGRCRLQFLETPGHTPEGISVLVTDLDRGGEPFAVLTGDTLFIGDVGRPDLSSEHTPQQLAAMMYDSLHGKLLALPDAVEVYPAHGAGSLCGRNISAERSSTIGHERAHNLALAPMSRDEFVGFMTVGLPERPAYFATDAEINRKGAPSLASLPPLVALSPEAAAREVEQGAVILDTRPADPYGAGHIPGSMHIGLGGTFAAWAGTLIGLDRPLVLVAENRDRAQEARLRLSRVGIDSVAGFVAGGVDAWSASGRPISVTPQISVHELRQRMSRPAGPGFPQVVDVRRPLEWEGGHLEGATSVPLDALGKSLASFDRDRPIALNCRSGYRSSIATSLLEREGFRDLCNVTGGTDAWIAEGLPMVSDASGSPCTKNAPLSAPAAAG